MVDRPRAERRNSKPVLYDLRAGYYRDDMTVAEMAALVVELVTLIELAVITDGKIPAMTIPAK